MTKLMKIILIVALFLFIIALIWAAIYTRNHKKEETKTTSTNTQTTNTTPTVTSTPSLIATPVADTTPAPVPPKKPAQKVIRYYTTTTVEGSDSTETSSSSNSAEAWASAGVNADGSTYAESHAQ